MVQNDIYTLGIDIGSTTVKIAVLDQDNEVLFSDYERHFANIQETLSDLLGRAIHKLGAIHVSPVITGSGGLTLAKHLGVPFVQEVIAVSGLFARSIHFVISAKPKKAYMYNLLSHSGCCPGRKCRLAEEQCRKKQRKETGDKTPDRAAP